MKIALAPDSFKDSLSAKNVCRALEAGIKRVAPQTETIHIPLADGGEGTVHALVEATGGRYVSANVVGPLGNEITAQFGILGDNDTAVIEMATASGLPLVPHDQRNPLYTTSYGTGQLLKSAVEEYFCSKIILGIGGSATTDCGTGMAQALGAQFFNESLNQITDYMTGMTMGRVEFIRPPVNNFMQHVNLTVACDVDNPLLGERGAVYVYGPQKGADENDLELLEQNMVHISSLIEETTGRSIKMVPGAGAAGGLGAGLLAFTNATLKSGIDIILDAVDFDLKIYNVDYIFTGEGRVDFQTAQGKTISGVLNRARKFGKPVIVLAGSVGDDLSELYEMGAKAIFSISSGPASLQESLEHTEQLLINCSENIFRLIHK